MLKTLHESEQRLQRYSRLNQSTLVHCSCLTINDFAVQAKMVAVEISIDVGNILWIYNCLCKNLDLQKLCVCNGVYDLRLLYMDDDIHQALIIKL